MLKIPRALRRNKLTIDKVSESLACTSGRWPTVVELAEACDLSVEQINDDAQLARIGDQRSLDEKFELDDSDEGLALAEYVRCVDERFDLSIGRLTLATVLDTLPARERTIFQLRFYKGMSQRQIAEVINISQIHVSRL